MHRGLFAVWRVDVVQVRAVDYLIPCVFPLQDHLSGIPFEGTLVARQAIELMREMGEIRPFQLVLQADVRGDCGANLGKGYCDREGKRGFQSTLPGAVHDLHPLWHQFEPYDLPWFTNESTLSSELLQSL